MNEALSNRRLATLALSTFMVCSLARLVYLAGDARLEFPLRQHPWIGPRLHALLKNVPKPTPVVKRTIDTNMLSLQSNMKEYHCAIEGQVTCAGQPCAADVRVVFESDHNPQILQNARAREDGTFILNVFLKERPLHSIDWRFQATGRNGAVAEVQGRKILTDERDIAMVPALHLP